MENKTAVQWLIEMLTEYKYLNKDADHYFEQAKEMEKEQIIDALFFGIHLEYNNIDSPLERAEQYYNETYGKTA